MCRHLGRASTCTGIKHQRENKKCSLQDIRLEYFSEDKVLCLSKNDQTNSHTIFFHPSKPLFFYAAKSCHSLTNNQNFLSVSQSCKSHSTKYEMPKVKLFWYLLKQLQTYNTTLKMQLMVKPHTNKTTTKKPLSEFMRHLSTSEIMCCGLTQRNRNEISKEMITLKKKSERISTTRHCTA